jgi:hypothetical protein
MTLPTDQWCPRCGESLLTHGLTCREQSSAVVQTHSVIAFEAGHTFDPTMQLRWLNSKDSWGSPICTLQQAWICPTTGETEWRDVEEVSK